MSPAPARKIKKKDGARVVKESGGGKGEIKIEAVNGELRITWLCGGTYRWSAKAARAQYGRLLMFPGNFEGIWMGDRASGRQSGYYGSDDRYSCRVQDGKFFATDQPGPDGDATMAERSVSWAQFNRALSAAIQELPGDPTHEIAQ